MIAFWAWLPRWAKIALPGSILALGGVLWLLHRSYEAGRAAERLKADDERIAQAVAFQTVKAAAVAQAYRDGAAAIAVANQLHDSVRVVDTVTVEISLPALPGLSVSPKQTVTLPSIVVRRMVADSLALAGAQAIITTQAALIVADSGVNDALRKENADLRASKAPVCAGKCKAAAQVVKLAIVTEAVIRLVRFVRR